MRQAQEMNPPISNGSNEISQEEGWRTIHYNGRRYKKGPYAPATVAVQWEETGMSETKTAIVGEEETFEFRFEEGVDHEVEARGKRECETPEKNKIQKKAKEGESSSSEDDMEIENRVLLPLPGTGQGTSLQEEMMEVQTSGRKIEEGRTE